MWALLYGVGVGAVLALAGWATYKIAPRFGPNPIFGVRTGYSMVNKEVWDLSQRAGGLMLALAGAVLAVATILLVVFGQWGEETTVLIITGLMFLVLVVGITWLVLYTHKLAKGVTPENARPIRVSLVWLWPAALLAAATTVFLLATASQLPAERVATHFGVDGTANDWMSRTAHLTFGIALITGMFALEAGILYLVTHASIPGADAWSISGEAIMRFFAVVMTGAQTLIGAVYLDIYWFNVRGGHIVPLGIFTIVVLLATAVAMPAGILFVWWKSTQGKGQRA